MKFITEHKALSVIAVIVIAVLAFGLSMFGYLNGVRDEAIRKEQDLIQTYKASQTELSTYTNTIAESIGVAEMGTDATKAILADAIRGRYEGNMEPGTDGSMFSAITEAYPDLSKNMDLYAKIQTMVESGRAKFGGTQKRLSSEASAYNTWRLQGAIRSNVVRTMGFPSDNLKITVNGQTLRGVDALEKMEEVIMSTDASQSFETGVSDPVIGGNK